MNVFSAVFIARWKFHKWVTILCGARAETARQFCWERGRVDNRAPERQSGRVGRAFIDHYNWLKVIYNYYINLSFLLVFPLHAPNLKYLIRQWTYNTTRYKYVCEYFIISTWTVYKTMQYAYIVLSHSKQIL